MMQRHRVRFLVLLSLVWAALSSGCASTIARMSVDGMKPIMDDMRTASKSCPDSELVRQAMPALLTQMDGFILVSPENRHLLTSAAEANMGYAFMYVEDVDKQRACMQYLKARDYALRNLSLNVTFKTALEGTDDEAFIKALKTIHKRDIAPLYFATNAWLQWLNLSHGENPGVLKDLPRVEAMMDRLLLLDDTFYHGGPHILMGVYYVAKPEMFGGQPDEAAAHFKEAFEISQSKYLLWYYLHAKYYAVQVKDRALFESSLNRIVSAPDGLDPEEAFTNSAVKIKARELLLHADDYFKQP